MRFLLPLVVFGIASTMLVALAQDSQVVIPSDSCAEAYAVTLLAASEACIGKPYGYVCNAGVQPQVEPPGPVANALVSPGGLVSARDVMSIRTAGIDGRGTYAGIAYLRVAEDNSPVAYGSLLIGDVSVRNVTPPDFPTWQSFIVQSVDSAERCEAAPYSTFVIQNPVAGQSARVVINGVSIDLNGTLAVQTTSAATIFFVLSGEVGATANLVRQTAVAGQEMSVTHEPGNFARPTSTLTTPVPFRQERVNHLPLPLFDRPIQLAQGGMATTTGPVNLRTAPSTDAAILLQTASQTRVTLLGRNAAGTWYHVRIPSGLTGWMLGELLLGDFSQVSLTYEATPAPVQRLGSVGQRGHVIAPNGFDLRSAPDIGFPVINYLPAGAEFTIIASSPYSPWVSIETESGVRGWIALLAIETRAIIDALPVDYQVPDPPAPTRIPGSWGNAFPDPYCYPDC